MSNELYAAVIGGLVGSIVGAIATAFVTGHQKRVADNERREVIAAQLAREIGFAVLNLISLSKMSPGAIPHFEADELRLPWSERMSEWATLFAPSTVALVSDFAKYAEDAKRVHTQIRTAFDYSKGAANWTPFSRVIEHAISTGISACSVLERLSVAQVNNPPLEEIEIESFRKKQLARLKREQSR